MNKSILLGSALAVALSAPAMAADFHALNGLQGATPAPLMDGVLAATEGGAACIAGTGAAAGGLVDNIGVALCAALPTAGGTNFANFAVFNAAPVTAAQFLQVVGF
ncbi:MAG: hypothetical protein ACREVY_10770 [Gammaproteobacteria bacterium]